MMLKNTANQLIHYLKKPLYGVSASTAYNLPNSLIHIPVIVMLVYIGAYISRAGLKPLLAVYFVIALYTARDLVIMAYKSKSVPVVIWGIFIPFIVFKKEVAEYLTFSSEDSITITLAFVAAFLVYIPVYIKKFLER